MRVHWVYDTIRHLLNSWGYCVVVIGLLGENAGVPIPGETVLMFASFMANKGNSLQIEWLILIASAAAILGDNTGFFLGRHFGRTFIRWGRTLLRLDDDEIGAARNLIRTHGGRAIFFSRFIFGLRTIAGPVAGSLGMEWKRFLKFNALGAVAWVTTIALIGYAFATKFQTLLGYIEKASWAVTGGLFLLGYFLWRRAKHKYERSGPRQKAA